MKTAIQSPTAPAAIGPYSQAIAATAGRFLFLSGQIPLDPATGAVVEGDVQAQAHQVMRNLRAVLEAAGGSLDNLVKTTVFLRDLNDFAAVNGVYASYLTPPFPARATVEVKRLPRDVAVEIDGIAVVD
ncbi:MAG: RidA family protein [Myxococcales bacterium]|nr:RidA family protein [Myxococcales bacterium]